MPRPLALNAAKSIYGMVDEEDNLIFTRSIFSYAYPDLHNTQFNETAAPELRAHPDPLVLHHGSFLWCRDYLALSPSYCFVIDDGEGKAVGYTIATPSTPKFVSEYRSKLLPIVKSQYNIKPDSPTTQINNVSVGDESDLARQFRELIFNPEHMLHEDYPNLVGEHPAHLHIDILASHTGQGWGEKLINTLLAKLRAEGVKGIHLGMSAANRRAGKFYDRIDFVRFDEMEEEGEKGRQGDGLYRVKKI